MEAKLKINKNFPPNIKVRVGWFGNERRDEKDTLTNLKVALYNQKTRPFWSVWKNKNKEAYRKAFIVIFKKYAFKDNEALENAYSQLGLAMRNDLQHTILYGEWLPNKQSTIERKKSSRPLIHTAQMLNSIRVVVVKDGKSVIIL